MEPKIPLLCSCEVCQNIIVCFSNEFRFGTSEEHADYTKIYGHNRIQPGNWLYFKKAVKPGLVKSCFQTQDKDKLGFLEYSGSVDPTDVGSLGNMFKSNFNEKCFWG